MSARLFKFYFSDSNVFREMITSQQLFFDYFVNLFFIIEKNRIFVKMDISAKSYEKQICFD